MKVFLSWSGEVSKQLAEIFKEWLPNVLQYIEPYMSSQDIELGERWNENIVSSLSETDYGLVFVTPENIKAPWINFEAGALSKTLSSRVIPILFNTDVMILQEGPLKQFQSTKTIDNQSIYRLVKDMNGSSSQYTLESERLKKSFDMWWPHLERQIRDIKVQNEGTEEKIDEKEVLSIILNKLSSQEKMLRGIKNEKQFESKKVNDNVLSYKAVEDLEYVHRNLNNILADLNGIHDRENVFGETINSLENSVESIGRVHSHLIQALTR